MYCITGRGTPVDADAAGHEGDEGARNERGADKDGSAVLRHAEASGLTADADGAAAAGLAVAAIAVVLAAAARHIDRGAWRVQRRWRALRTWIITPVSHA